METHDKLVASVWNQVLNDDTLRGTVEERRPESEPVVHQSSVVVKEISNQDDQLGQIIQNYTSVTTSDANYRLVH